MINYEYIRLLLDMGDLTELNGLSGSGWRVVAIVECPKSFDAPRRYALLERPLPFPITKVTVQAF